MIGIVCGRMGDLYKVDIGNDTKAMLPFLAFEGATRRNRPVLKVSGDQTLLEFVSLLYFRMAS